jgi:hypothetical protein
MASGCVSEAGLIDREAYDRWFQAPNDQVDILWVIDDSSSMRDEQEILSTGILSFTDQLEDSGADFQVGVVTTSADGAQGGVLVGDPPFLTMADDYRQVLPSRTLVGVRGSDKEKGLEVATLATQSIGVTNAGFVRPDASLMVAIVSDEDDCSDAGALDGSSPNDCVLRSEELVPVVEYVQAFRDLKTNPLDVQVAAIVGTRDSACSDSYPGERYIQAAMLTNGLIGDICEPDWSEMLYEMGLNATGIRTHFFLSQPAVLDDLVVLVDGVAVDAGEEHGWTYDSERCELTFHGDGIPERDTEITALYTIASGATCN